MDNPNMSNPIFLSLNNFRPSVILNFNAFTLMLLDLVQTIPHRDHSRNNGLHV